MKLPRRQFLQAAHGAALLRLDVGAIIAARTIAAIIFFIGVRLSFLTLRVDKAVFSCVSFGTSNQTFPL
jgi:hypothetical protein